MLDGGTLFAAVEGTGDSWNDACTVAESGRSRATVFNTNDNRADDVRDAAALTGLINGDVKPASPLLEAGNVKTRTSPLISDVSLDARFAGSRVSVDQQLIRNSENGRDELATDQWFANADAEGEGTTPWRNPLNPYDVNGDTRVSPIDALYVIHRLNTEGGGPLPLPDPGFEPPPYMDVSGDGYVSPIDALQVISVLNGDGYVPPPSDLAATVLSPSSIALTWRDNSTFEEGFRIERSQNGVDFLAIATLANNVTMFIDSNLFADTRYDYRVRAFYGTNNSEYSSVTSATTDSDPLA